MATIGSHQKYGVTPATAKRWQSQPRAVAKARHPVDHKMIRGWELDAGPTNITGALACAANAAAGASCGNLTAVGGVSPYTWAITTANPLVNVSNTGAVTLKAANPAAGSYPYSFRVTDSFGKQFTKSITLTVT